MFINQNMITCWLLLSCRKTQYIHAHMHAHLSTRHHTLRCKCKYVFYILAHVCMICTCARLYVCVITRFRLSVHLCNQNAVAFVHLRTCMHACASCTHAWLHARAYHMHVLITRMCFLHACLIACTCLSHARAHHTHVLLARIPDCMHVLITCTWSSHACGCCTDGLNVHTCSLHVFAHHTCVLIAHGACCTHVLVAHTCLLHACAYFMHALVACMFLMHACTYSKVTGMCMMCSLFPRRVH